VVYVNWTWAWFTYGRGSRLITDVPANEGPEEGGEARALKPPSRSAPPP
jgi:hypothetical protein